MTDRYTGYTDQRLSTTSNPTRDSYKELSTLNSASSHAAAVRTLTRGNSARDRIETRRSTPNNQPPTIGTIPPGHRLVKYISGDVRPTSDFCSSATESNDAMPRHGAHHKQQYSGTAVNTDMRDGDLQVMQVRKLSSALPRSRTTYPSQPVRHANTEAEDYHNDGYGAVHPPMQRFPQIDTTSLYPDRKPRREPREDYNERQERPEWSKRNSEVERQEQIEYADSVNIRRSGEDPADHQELRGAFGVGLAIAGTTLDVTQAAKYIIRDTRGHSGDRNDRRRDSDENYPRSENAPTPRNNRPRYDADVKVDGPSQVPVPDSSERDLRERKSSEEKRDNGLQGRKRSVSFTARKYSPRPLRGKSWQKRMPDVAVRGSDSRYTTNLNPLEGELKSERPAHKVTSEEPESLMKDPGEVAKVWEEVNEIPQRVPIASNKKRQRPKVEGKPAKGILRSPRRKFPEDPAPIREGVAPLKDAKKGGISPEDRFTELSRDLVNPEALEAGQERFEVKQHFVIVWRVLTPDEVQIYAVATEIIRTVREDLREFKAQVYIKVRQIRQKSLDVTWTRIGRKLVNPEALEAGKETFEVREDYVFVCRVLTRDEVQIYAEATEIIRAVREDLREFKAQVYIKVRQIRRERHEHHKQERRNSKIRCRERREHR